MKYVDFWFDTDKILADKRPRINTRTHRAYPDKEREAYKAMVRNAFHDISVRHSDYKGEVTLNITCLRSLPESRPKRIESEPDTFKPDVDNIAKLVMDALNDFAWNDDSQVTHLVVIKERRSRIKMERCYIRIGYADMEDANG